MCVLETERLLLRPPQAVATFRAMTVWLGDFDVRE